jgi:hypothetical protein
MDPRITKLGFHILVQLTRASRLRFIGVSCPTALSTRSHRQPEDGRRKIVQKNDSGLVYLDGRVTSIAPNTSGAFEVNNIATFSYTISSYDWNIIVSGTSRSLWRPRIQIRMHDRWLGNLWVFVVELGKMSPFTDSSGSSQIDSRASLILLYGIFSLLTLTAGSLSCLVWEMGCNFNVLNWGV